MRYKLVLKVFICNPALWYSVPSCNHWVGKASKNFKMMTKNPGYLECRVKGREGESLENPPEKLPSKKKL